MISLNFLGKYRGFALTSSQQGGKNVTEYD